MRSKNISLVLNVKHIHGTYFKYIYQIYLLNVIYDMLNLLLINWVNYYIVNVIKL